jgi:hypothetical protein
VPDAAGLTARWDGWTVAAKPERAFGYGCVGAWGGVVTVARVRPCVDRDDVGGGGTHRNTVWTQRGPCGGRVGVRTFGRTFVRRVLRCVRVANGRSGPYGPVVDNVWTTCGQPKHGRDARTHRNKRSTNTTRQTTRFPTRRSTRLNGGFPPVVGVVCPVGGGGFRPVSSDPPCRVLALPATKDEIEAPE